MQINIKNIKKDDRFWDNQSQQFVAVEDTKRVVAKANFELTGEREFISYTVAAKRLTGTPVLVGFTVVEGAEKYSQGLYTSRNG